MLKEINSQNFNKEIIESGELILVDFFATWCPPCKMLSPILERIAESRAGYNIGKINIDESQELAIKYGVEAVPTMILFKGGEVVNKMVGLLDEEEIINVFSKYM